MSLGHLYPIILLLARYSALCVAGCWLLPSAVILCNSSNLQESRVSGSMHGMHCTGVPCSLADFALCPIVASVVSSDLVDSDPCLAANSVPTICRVMVHEPKSNMIDGDQETSLHPGARRPPESRLGGQC